MEMLGHPVGIGVKTGKLDGELALKLVLAGTIKDTHPFTEAVGERLGYIADEINGAIDRTHRRIELAEAGEGGIVPMPPPTESTFSAIVLGAHGHRLRVWPAPRADLPTEATPHLDLIGVKLGESPKSATVKIEDDRVSYRLEILYPMANVHAACSDLAELDGSIVYVDLTELQIEAEGKGFERTPARSRRRHSPAEDRQTLLGHDIGRSLPSPDEGDFGPQGPRALPGGTILALPPPDDTSNDDVIDVEIIENADDATANADELAWDVRLRLKREAGELADFLEELPSSEAVSLYQELTGAKSRPRASTARVRIVRFIDRLIAKGQAA